MKSIIKFLVIVALFIQNFFGLSVNCLADEKDNSANKDKSSESGSHDTVCVT